MKRKYKSQPLTAEQREEQMKAHWMRRDREEKTGNIYGYTYRTPAGDQYKGRGIAVIVMAFWVVAVSLIAVIWGVTQTING